MGIDRMQFLNSEKNLILPSQFFPIPLFKETEYWDPVSEHLS